MSKLFLVGATGFIGQNFLPALLKETQHQVYVLSRKNKQFADHKSIIPVVGDLLDLDSLLNTMPEGAVIINLAYLVGNNPEHNIAAIKNLLKAAKINKASRLVHLSTAVVVGKSKFQSVSEATPCQPSNDYEKNKYDIENIVQQVATPDFPVTIIRPTAVFGHGGQNLNKIIRDVCTQGRLLGSIKSALLGQRSMNLVSVNKVVAFLMFALNRLPARSFECFIVSDDDSDNNNFSYVVKRVRDAYLMPPLIPIYLPFSKIILKMVFKLKKISTFEIYRKYQMEHANKAGFQFESSFESELANFLCWHQNEHSD